MKPEITRVLRGRGLELGPATTRFEQSRRTIPNLLTAQAAHYGDKPWLIFDGKDVLSFAEGERLMNTVANAILRSIGPGKHVGIHLRNQLEFMPAENGALAVGVAVPLNADARGPLLQWQIERADISLLIVRADQLEWIAALPSLGICEAVVVVGEGELLELASGVPVIGWTEWLDGLPATLEAEPPVWDELAVIAFTSGTTGRAKGVMHTHHYWYLFSSTITDSLERSEDDVLTSPLPVYHGGALHLIANSALHAGCTGHLQSRFSPSSFWADAARDQATYAFLLGPLAAMIDRETPEDAVPEHRVSTIYCVPSPPNRPEFERRFKTTILRQGWAMTEIFPCLMRNEQIAEQPEDSIGYPASWFDYAVLDPDDNILAPGEVGELAWRCNIPYGMFHGYYKDPEVTAEAFRNSWFHTGDGASYEADGLLRFRGRLRDRIRRRGEMVTAGEVEYIAMLHDNVREAAAYGVPAEVGEEDVKLDLILARPMELSEMHEWLAANLPRFMVPRYLEARDEFPKTSSLRIEKYKLKSLPLDRPEVLDTGAGGRV